MNRDVWQVVKFSTLFAFYCALVVVGAVVLLIALGVPAPLVAIAVTLGLAAVLYFYPPAR